MDLDLACPDRTCPDLTCAVSPLTGAASQLVTLLPGKPVDPVLAGVRLAATATGVTLAGTDRERAIRLAPSAPSRIHAEGEVLVPARMFAETLRGLDVQEIRLVREGNKLALHTPSARFALPLMVITKHPGIRPGSGWPAERCQWRNLPRCLAAGSPTSCMPYTTSKLSSRGTRRRTPGGACCVRRESGCAASLRPNVDRRSLP